jgi:hypothetical protein
MWVVPRRPTQQQQLFEASFVSRTVEIGLCKQAKYLPEPLSLSLSLSPFISFALTHIDKHDRMRTVEIHE